MRTGDASGDALGAANALWDDSVNAQVRLMLRGGGGAELADFGRTPAVGACAICTAPSMRSYDASVDALGAANALCDDSGNAQVRVILKIVAYTYSIDRCATTHSC